MSALDYMLIVPSLFIAGYLLIRWGRKIKVSNKVAPLWRENPSGWVTVSPRALSVNPGEELTFSEENIFIPRAVEDWWVAKSQMKTLSCIMSLREFAPEKDKLEHRRCLTIASAMFEIDMPKDMVLIDIQTKILARIFLNRQNSRELRRDHIAIDKEQSVMQYKTITEYEEDVAKGMPGHAPSLKDDALAFYHSYRAKIAPYLIVHLSSEIAPEISAFNKYMFELHGIESHDINQHLCMITVNAIAQHMQLKIPNYWVVVSDATEYVISQTEPKKTENKAPKISLVVDNQ